MAVCMKSMGYYHNQRAFSGHAEKLWRELGSPPK